ncbi:MAG: polysulfide reductase NrfD [Pseudomonadales bacterium]|nr:polysulfide reductase NrfD [Halioglobus sp.]MCP5122153.1 polysulfide reductase NrfD [Pseudomonadales bacterium]MCP5192302.1 polysulfide reductase NrfD [Pseudomonadales bacterium]
MSIENKVFSGDTLRVGYRFQRHWDNSMAYAFFCAELGAGLYFVSLLLNSIVGMALGLLLVSTGKPYFHLAHMGVPTKSWRAMLRPDRSWISRGVWLLAGLIGAGFLYLAASLFGDSLGLEANSAVLWLLKIAAAACALGVMTYQGFAMSHSSAIAIWNSAIMPMASLLYSLAVGLAVARALVPPAQASGLTDTLLLLLLGLAVMHLMFLHSGWHGGPGARTSVELLLQSVYAKWFWGLVVAVGIVLPGLALSAVPASALAGAVSAVAVLAGFMAWRILIFKIGVFEPIMRMNPFHTAG